MATKTDFKSKPNIKNQKKERPFCSHCNIPGLTIEKCYKIHGFPSGYKPKVRVQANAAQTESSGDQDNKKPTTLSTLTNDQCGQLIAMLSEKLVSTGSSTPANDDASPSFMTGTCAMENTCSSFPSNSIWILDSSGSRHICTGRSWFQNIIPLENSLVTLPNHTSIPVHFYGDVKIIVGLLLKEVLYVPSLRFNLLSVSALTIRST